MMRRRSSSSLPASRTYSAPPVSVMSAGPCWSGIAGKVNPNGAFSVGSGKENGYATYRALTDPDDPGYRAIRHLETAE